jgi:TonB-linked SusC/RagA family outer membrane protein
MKRHLTILKKLCNKFTISISLLAALIFSVPNNVTAQGTTVSGTVTGDNNTPLNAVSVTVKGSAKGTSTNSSGQFTLSAPSTATLVFSSVGYTNKEVAMSGQSTINVSLTAASQELTQVIVVGYGTQRKIDVTGSVANVKGADIAKQPVLTATQAIQGKVAGVQIISSGDPNSSPTVRIRGVGTMLGGAAPLYVVDGVITDDIRNINSADIVSVDILKDASATAIYGMRAANGVLLITTKKGRTGKMIVAYDGSVGVKEIAKLVNMAGANQYANYVNEASVYYGSGDSLIRNAQLAAGANTDWYDAITKKSLIQNHNLSVSGGSDKINYFLSAGYVGDGGIIKTNKFDRFTLRSNNEYKFTNALRLSTLVSYSRTNLRDVDLSVFDIAYRAAPYVPSKVGNLYGNTSLSNNIANPLLNLDKNNNTSIANRLQGTFALDFKPISWLALRSSFGIDLNFYNNITYSYKYANTGDNNVFLTAGGNQLVNRSQLAVQNDNSNKWVWDNTATITQILGRHNFSLLLGTTSEQFKFNTAQGTRLDVPENKDQWYLDAGVPSSATNKNSGDKWSRNSYLSRLNYSYNSRYLLTATFRADGTSRFPSQNRWGYFPSVGLGWNITKEAFMSGQKTFDNLKLRGSWGKVGNDQIASNLYNPLATLNVPYFYSGSEYLGISFDQAVDKNLKWETTEEYDLGLDFTVLKNKLSGSVEYYDKKTNNALINIAFNGQVLGDVDNLYTTNAASFSNKGVEFSLNWNDRVNKDWNYNINGNIAFNKNKITGLNGGQALTAGSVGSQGFTTKSDNGQTIGSFYVLQADGIFKNADEVKASAQPDAQPGDIKYKDISGPDGKPDGVINDNDRAYSGSYQPKFTYGVNGGVSYKTFDFSFGTYGTSGGKIYNGKKAARADSRDNVETEIAKNRWTPNNPNTNVPRANLNALQASTYFIEDASFFRINNLTLGYALPRNFLSRYKIQNLRIYVTAQNLATITGYSGFTPELVPSGTASSTLDAGIEQRIYPTTRTFAFGVNLGF